MRIFVLFLLILNISLQAKYLDSESCKECHEKIYMEHSSSMHHGSSIFGDEIHRKVKEAVSKDKYSCALCHMPASKNLAAVIRGSEQPDHKDKRDTDGVSCFYCHQISKVHYTKAYNINFSSAKDGEKPIMFGNLQDPDSSDKHEMQNNEIYKNSEVCMGCHSHKENTLGFEVCNTKNELDLRSDCIGCHMPKASGGNEKFNKKGRSEYATHEFLGIHSADMIKKAVKLGVTYKGNIIELSIQNRMGHSIITHPMRLKFVKTIVLRDGKIIWSNFKKTPMEDKEATFIIVFKDKNNKASMPNSAIGYKLNQNLKANSKKIIRYDLLDLKKGDEIRSTWTSYIINPKIAKKLEITKEDLVKPYIGEEVSVIVR